MKRPILTHTPLPSCSQAIVFHLLATACLAGSLTAAPIRGTLNLRAGSVLDHPDLQTTTGILSWTNPAVLNRDGDFVDLIAPEQAVNLVAPWSFESDPVNQFWSVGGFVFDLVNSQIIEQDATQLLVTGTGFIRGNGFDPTPGNWNYGRQAPAAARAFSAQSEEFGWFTFTTAPPAASVPEAGATVWLVAAGVAGLGMALRWTKRRPLS